MLTSCNFSGGSASPRFVLDVIFARVLAWFVFQSIVYQLYNIAGPTKDGLIGLGNVFLVRLRQGFWWFHRFKICSSNAFEFFVYTGTFLAPLPTAYQEITHPSTSSWCERRLGKFRTCGQNLANGRVLHNTTAWRWVQVHLPTVALLPNCHANCQRQVFGYCSLVEEPTAPVGSELLCCILIS